MKKQPVQSQMEIYYERKNKAKENRNIFLKEFGIGALIVVPSIAVIIATIGGIAAFFSMEDYGKLKNTVKMLEERPVYTECSTCKRIEEEKWGKPRVEGWWSRPMTNVWFIGANWYTTNVWMKDWAITNN